MKCVQNYELKIFTSSIHDIKKLIFYISSSNNTIKIQDQPVYYIYITYIFRFSCTNASQLAAMSYLNSNILVLEIIHNNSTGNCS